MNLDIFAVESWFQEAAFLMRGPVDAPKLKVCFLTPSGATFKEVSRGVLKNIEYLRPTAKPVRRSEDAAVLMAEQSLTLQNQIQNLYQTRDLLLPRLVSGQVELATQ